MHRGRAVRLGRDLVVATPKLIGPEVADPTHRFSGNNLSCQNCHLNAGTGKFALPFVGVFADFPQLSGARGTGRYSRGPNKRMHDAQPERPRTAIRWTRDAGHRGILKFLSTGIPIGAVTPGRGAAEMPLLERAADPTHRRRGLPADLCRLSRCERRWPAQRARRQGYAFPPLWGPDSFNDGAGMARLITIAGFVHGNMPAGTTWQNPALTIDEPRDVAAYV